MKGFVRVSLVIAAVCAGQGAFALDVALTQDYRYVGNEFWQETPNQPGKDFDYHYQYYGVFQTSTAPKPATNGQNPQVYTFDGSGLSWYEYDCSWSGCLHSQYVRSHYSITFTVDKDAILDLSLSFDAEGDSYRYGVRVEETSQRIRVIDYEAFRLPGPFQVTESAELEAGKTYSLLVLHYPAYSEGALIRASISWAIDGSITEIADVDIDVLPYEDPNMVYPNKTGKLPVAVLSSAEFDATQVDPATLRFGPAGASRTGPAVVEDVDSLHGNDLKAKFRVEETGIMCNDTEVRLTGETYAGDPIAGTDTIDASQCESGGCHGY